MNTSTIPTTPHAMNHFIMIPLSLLCILIAFTMACTILTLIICTKRLHTVTHLLICNGAVALIFYCLVQSTNYIFLALFPGETDDLLCRWRGFLGYMTVAAIVYSYLAQAISRLLISVFANKHRWAMSRRTHLLLIAIHWCIVLLIPLPALVTEDIYYRPNALCWVPKEYTLHVAYTVIAYYLIPTIMIFVIYIYIFLRVKRRRKSVFVIFRKLKSNRDVEVLYNIMILFAIYIVGALPIILFVLTKVEMLYTIGMITLSLALAVEKGATVLIDRDIRTVIQQYFRQTMTKVRPTTITRW